MTASSCILNSITPFFYIALVIILGVFVLAISRISKRNAKLYEEAGVRQQEMMDRQKESVQLLREIRDLLKK